jgi:hypothetical protein
MTTTETNKETGTMKTADRLTAEIGNTYGQGWHSDTCNETFGGNGWIKCGAKWDSHVRLQTLLAKWVAAGVTHINLRVYDAFNVRHDADFCIA